ncbi:MAG: sugar ABC transporter substrate-binding protein, partial [Butyrivibrio sp.]|nr:sugar ABC transporter substrate-binding protein [Butyrivibrio sp.]
MKKKLVSVLLSAAMGATLLAGCGQQAAQEAAETAETVAETAQETTEAAQEATEAPAEAAEEITDYGTGEVKVWVADAVVDFTNQQIAKFQEAHPEMSGYTFTVEATGEGDAAGNMITDVEAGADVYVFAQDQIARLVSAGALEEVEPANAEMVKAQNDAGAVGAATVGNTLYAYPLTSDNGYF